MRPPRFDWGWIPNKHYWVVSLGVSIDLASKGPTRNGYIFIDLIFIYVIIKIGGAP